MEKTKITDLLIASERPQKPLLVAAHHLQLTGMVSEIASHAVKPTTARMSMNVQVTTFGSEEFDGRLT